MLPSLRLGHHNFQVVKIAVELEHETMPAVAYCCYLFIMLVVISILLSLMCIVFIFIV